MASIVVGTTIFGTIADGSGLSNQSHEIYAVNDSAWWLFFLGSGSTNTVQCYRSPDRITWTAKTSSGVLSTAIVAGASHGSQGRNLSVEYQNIAGNDVVHIDLGVKGTTLADNQHIRATISSGTITWGSWSDIPTSSPPTFASADYPAGTASCINANGRPFFISPFAITADLGKPVACQANNTDSGTSWTAGFTTGTQLQSVTNQCNAAALVPLSGANVLAFWENAVVAEPNSLKTVVFSLWNGTSWSVGVGVNTALASGVDPNSWGVVARTATDVHFVLCGPNNTFTHKRYNGTDFTTVPGVAIQAQNCNTGQGVFLATDGTNVFMFIIDNDANNTVRWCAWLSALNLWTCWSALENSAKTRKYISGCPQANSNGMIGVHWTETNGGSFDAVVNTFAIPTVFRLQSKKATGTTTVGVTLTATQGSTLLAATLTEDPFLATNGTLAAPANWQLAKNEPIAAAGQASIFYYLNAPASITTTGNFSSTVTGAGLSLQVEEIYGLAGGGALDVVAGNFGTTGTTDSGTTVMSAQANSYCVAVIGAANAIQSGTFSLPLQGFTLVAQQVSPNANILTQSVMLTFLQTANSTENTGATMSGTVTHWAGAIATFKDASSFAGDEDTGLTFQTSTWW